MVVRSEVAIAQRPSSPYYKTMTCIVAILSDNGSVVMGCDRAASNEDHLLVYKKTKIFQNGQALIGFSGSFRNAQIVEYEFKMPERPYGLSTMEYMITYFVRDLKKALKKSEAIETVNGVCSLDCDLLVAYSGRLFTIMSDFHVAELRQNYSCIGSGAQAALGALYALKQDGSYTAYDSAHLALRAAAKCTTSVIGPFYVVETFV